MRPSQIFSTLTCFSLQILSTSFLKHTTALPLTVWNYIALTITSLKWAFDVLLYKQYSLSAPRLYDIMSPNIGSEELIRITPYECSYKEEGEQSTDNEVNVCAVCLSEVEEGEEIGELRCRHVFHHICLQRWVRLGHTTCPLCRGSLAPPRLISTAAEADFGVEVLFFKFCSFRSNDDERDSWWLR